MIQKALKKLLDGEELTANEIGAVAEQMMEGEATPVLISSFLTALRMRGDRADDILAFARVLRSRAVAFHRDEGIVLDTCGTGGDHSGSFNISTAAALIAAGAGVKVAKHGNRSMTSKCGSADVLAALGVCTDCPTKVMEQALREAGICFLFAQQYHQSMRHVGPVRRELGFRTIFNLLGPLANPARAAHQLIGVFAPSVVDIHASVLARLGAKHALVVHGSDGLDEITTTGPTHVAEVRDGDIRKMQISPTDYGIPLAKSQDLMGGDPPENARIIGDILDGKPGPRSDIALLNAGAAIFVADGADSIAAGIEAARKSVASGSAREKLRMLRQITQPVAS